jgi:hypothetical protein
MMLIELGCIRFSQIFLEPLSRSQRIGYLRAEENRSRRFMFKSSSFHDHSETSVG